MTRHNPDLDQFFAEPLPVVKQPADLRSNALLDEFLSIRGWKDEKPGPPPLPVRKRAEPPPLPKRAIYISRTPCRIHWE